jgi:hypothetical protein
MKILTVVTTLLFSTYSFASNVQVGTITKIDDYYERKVDFGLCGDVSITQALMSCAMESLQVNDKFRLVTIRSIQGKNFEYKVETKYIANHKVGDKIQIDEK